MAPPKWDSKRARLEMVRLIAPGVLGFYTHLEVTEIFAVPAGQTEPINVFSILVAEERPSGEIETPHLLNPDRIRPKSLRDWIFGVKRYVRPISELIPAFDDRRLNRLASLTSSGLISTQDLRPSHLPARSLLRCLAMLALVVLRI
jgi:hypothetical protein